MSGKENAVYLDLIQKTCDLAEDLLPLKKMYVYSYFY